MTRQQVHASPESIDASIAELEHLILQHHPYATFRIESGIDDPNAIHLVAFVNFEDTFEVLDLVSDRMMDIQIDDGVPIFVIPMRPDERTISMNAATQPLPKALLTEEMISPPGPLS